MDLKEILENIHFIKRYQELCEEYDNLYGSLRGNKKRTYDEVLASFNYNTKYFKNGNFYKIEESSSNIKVVLHMCFRNGMVEFLLYPEIDGLETSSNGRFDFLPEKLGIPYDREKNIAYHYSRQKKS